MKEIYMIYYDNGEVYEEGWVGLLSEEGAFLKSESAELRVKALEIQHYERIKSEQEQGYTFPSFELESWKVVPIQLHE